MTEFCPEHSEVVRSLGRVEERQVSIGKTVEGIDQKVDKLVMNGAATDVREDTRTKERRWIHWVLVSAVGGALMILMQTIVPKLLRALGEVLK